MSDKVTDIRKKMQPYVLEKTPPLQVTHLFNACEVGDTALSCDKCMGMGFGVKVASVEAFIEHRLVCLTCGEEQPLLGNHDEKVRF